MVNVEKCAKNALFFYICLWLLEPCRVTNGAGLTVNWVDRGFTREVSTWSG